MIPASISAGWTNSTKKENRMVQKNQQDGLIKNREDTGAKRKLPILLTLVIISGIIAIVMSISFLNEWAQFKKQFSEELDELVANVVVPDGVDTNLLETKLDIYRRYKTHDFDDYNQAFLNKMLVETEKTTDNYHVYSYVYFNLSEDFDWTQLRCSIDLDVNGNVAHGTLKAILGFTRQQEDPTITYEMYQVLRDDGTIVTYIKDDIWYAYESKNSNYTHVAISPKDKVQEFANLKPREDSYPLYTEEHGAGLICYIDSRGSSLINDLFYADHNNNIFTIFTHDNYRFRGFSFMPTSWNYEQLQKVRESSQDSLLSLLFDRYGVNRSGYGMKFTDYDVIDSITIPTEIIETATLVESLDFLTSDVEILIHRAWLEG